MIWPGVKKILVRSAVFLAAISSTVIGIGFFPGSIEGIYSGPQCMCDCLNFTRVSDGRVVMYSSGHSPAQLLGRYQQNPDGSADIYMPPVMAGEPEDHVGRLIPRFWFTIFTNPHDGTSDWMWRRPKSGWVSRLIDNEEIKLVTIPNEKEILSTFYDASFNKLRTESKPIKKRKDADQAAPSNGDKPTN